MIRSCLCILFVFLFLSKAEAGKIVGDSTKNGAYYVYDDSSHLLLEAHYKDTLRTGVWKEYEKGLVIRKTRYRKGKVRWIRIYKNGVLMESINRKGVSLKRKECGC